MLRRTPGGAGRRFVTLVVAVCLLLAGCSSGGGVTRQGGEQGGFVPGDDVWTRVDPAQRKPAPAVSGTTLDGHRLDLAQYRGKVVVVNVWGSWCAPCRKEAPDLVEAARATKGRAQFVGLNTRDLDRAPAEAFVRAFEVPYPNLYDPQGELLLRFSDDLPPNGIPSTLVIDTEGRVAARVIGTATKSTLVGLVEDTAAGR